MKASLANVKRAKPARQSAYLSE